jgi:hypothetical protein
VLRHLRARMPRPDAVTAINTPGAQRRLMTLIGLIAFGIEGAGPGRSGNGLRRDE